MRQQYAHTLLKNYEILNLEEGFFRACGVSHVWHTEAAAQSLRDGVRDHDPIWRSPRRP